MLLFFLYNHPPFCLTALASVLMFNTLQYSLSPHIFLQMSHTFTLHSASCDESRDCIYEYLPTASYHGHLLRFVHSYSVDCVCMHTSVGFRLHMCVCFVFQCSNSPLGSLGYLNENPKETPILFKMSRPLPRLTVSSVFHMQCFSFLMSLYVFKLSQVSIAHFYIQCCWKCSVYCYLIEKSLFPNFTHKVATAFHHSVWQVWTRSFHFTLLYKQWDDIHLRKAVIGSHADIVIKLTARKWSHLVISVG